MIQKFKIVCTTLLMASVMFGCSGDVTGTYHLVDSERTVTFAKDGKFIMSSGDAGTYIIDGKTIVISSWAGGAKGEVDDGALIFPKSRGVVSGSFSGVWRKNGASKSVPAQDVADGRQVDDTAEKMQMSVQNTKPAANPQQISKAKQDIRALEAALNLYKLDNYVYPMTDQGLDALVQKPSSPEPPNWKAGGYIDSLPLDPWKQSYVYLSPGKHGAIDIYTLGADKVQSNDDIRNWEL